MGRVVVVTFDENEEEKLNELKNKHNIGDEVKIIKINNYIYLIK